MAHRMTYVDAEAASKSVIDETSFKHEKTCIICGKAFTIFSKKHHWYCQYSKICFHAVCKPCSAGKVFSEQRQRNVRTCDNCMKTETGNAKQEVEIKTAQIEEMIDLLQETESRLATTEAEKKTIGKQLIEANETIEKLKKELEINHLTTNLTEEESQVSALQLDSHQEEIRTSLEMYQRAQTQVLELTQQLEGKQREFALMKAEKQKLMEKKGKYQALKEKLKIIEANFKRAVEENEKMKTDFDALKQNHSTEIQKVREEKEALTSDLVSFKEQLDTQEMKLSRVRAYARAIIDS